MSAAAVRHLQPGTATKQVKPAPASFLKELRGVATFHSLQFVWGKQGMKRETQSSTLANNFWGDDRIKGSLAKLLDGEEAFSFLYDQVATPEGHDLYVKELIAPSGICVIGKHCTTDILSRSHITLATSAKVQARTLHDNAEMILKNCKKAQSLVSKLVNKIIYVNAATGLIESYYSGLNEDDFLMHINDGMYMLLKGNKAAVDGESIDQMPSLETEDSEESSTLNTSVEDDSSVNDSNNLSTSDIGAAAGGNRTAGGKSFGKKYGETDWSPYGGRAPDDYRFPGFATYACFGPHTSFFSSMINPLGNNYTKDDADGAAKKKRGGRQALRKEDAKQARVEREYGSERGMCMKDKAAMCSVAQNEEAAAMRDREAKLAELTVLVSSKERSRDSYFKLLDLTDGDEKKSLVDTIKQLTAEIAKHNSEIETLTLQKRAANPIVSAVMKQVAASMGVKEASSDIASDAGVDTVDTDEESDESGVVGV
jgi:hypothetical protein